jgi:hypothetical protein
MNIAKLLSLALLASLLLRGVTSAEARSDKELISACATTPAEARNKIKLKFRKSDAGSTVVEACFPDDPGHCIVDPSNRGYATVFSQPDFNHDGLKDVIVRDISLNYGGKHDVAHFVVFANCAKGVYLLIGEGMYYDVVLIEKNKARPWPPLRARRKCWDEKIGNFQVRSFTLTFDKSSFTYGPPNGDPELGLGYCRDKELSMPFVEDSE